MEDISVNFPDDIIDRFIIEGVIISPIENSIGWAFLSEYEDNNILLRIFLIEKDCENRAFELNSELSVFVFHTQVEMKKFYKQLLNMSALEYMILLKGTTAINIH